MKLSKRLSAACFAMDLCWLCAWANFMAVATTTIRFPLLAGVAAFLGAFSIRSFFMTGGGRRIWHVLAHACGAALLLKIAVYSVFDTIPPQTIYLWYQLIVVALILMLFWYKGIRMTTRSLSYESVCHHFDLGVSLLFAIALIKLIVKFKTGSTVEESFTVNAMCVFFLSGFTALFLSYTETGMRGTFLKGFRTYGLLLSVNSVLILVCVGSFFIFQSYMAGVAEDGLTALKTAAEVVVPYIKPFLLFLLKGRGSSSANLISQQAGDPSGTFQEISSDGPGTWEKQIAFGISIVVVLVLLCFIGYLLYRLYLFLMAKPQDASGTGEGIIAGIHGMIRDIFRYLKGLLRLFPGKIDDAGQGFVRLIKWGKRSGVAKTPDETPLEYAGRLQQRFYPLKDDIRIIVSAFQLEAYGKACLTRDNIEQVARAVKTIHSPGFWWIRIKSNWEK